MAKKKENKTAKSNPWVVATIVLGSLLVISLVAIAILGTLLSVQTTKTGTPTPAPSGNAQAPPSGNSGEVEIDLENAHILGDADADVIMVEYSSFTCGFCGRFHQQTLPLIKENYIDTGEVAFVYKHFLRNSEDARIANHAECAAEQGQLFEFVDLVFDNQQSISDSDLQGHAQELGLDMGEYNSCVESGRNSEIANAHYEEARSNGVTGTPTFFINGEKVVGAQPYSVFESALDAAQ